MGKKLNKREKKILKQVDWNDGFYLEGMDRCHCIMVMMEELLVDHPAVLKAKMARKLKKASDLVMEIYQEIGTVDYLNEERKKNKK